MLYVVTGILKTGVEDRMLELSQEFNEHLAQPFRSIATAGALYDRTGRRIGYWALVKGESFDEGQRFLEESPFYRSGLYARADVAELIVEVGRLSSADQ